MQRWDPEMLAARTAFDAEAAKYPPTLLEEPLDPHRAVNERLSLMFGHGGPAMADTADRWVFARGRRIACRLHRPRRDRALPVLFWFHGGGWVWQSIDTHDRLVRELAAAGEVATISVDYTLAPEARFPVAAEECAAVVRRVVAGAEAWGIDPDRVILGGDSAGGNLALAAALLLREHGGPALAGLHLIYPVTDTDFESPSYREFADGYGLTRAAMQAYWRLYLRGEEDEDNPLACPLKADLRGLPPMLVQVAELDVLRSDGERLAEKTRAAGGEATLLTYGGLVHGFMRHTERVTKARTAVADGGAWLRSIAGDG
jgi:acetyl esterase